MPSIEKHVDRVACPWLIARFVDSEAEFLFVPKSKVLEVAKNTEAMVIRVLLLLRHIFLQASFK